MWITAVSDVCLPNRSEQEIFSDNFSFFEYVWAWLVIGELEPGITKFVAAKKQTPTFCRNFNALPRGLSVGIFKSQLNRLGEYLLQKLNFTIGLAVVYQ